MSFSVFVDENSHYQDKSESYKNGDYETFEEALGVCKEIVDQYLKAAYKDGMNAADLYKSYITFGDDPYIVPKPDGESYSSWEYAKMRCAEICGTN